MTEFTQKATSTRTYRAQEVYSIYERSSEKRLHKKGELRRSRFVKNPLVSSPPPSVESA